MATLVSIDNFTTCSLIALVAYKFTTGPFKKTWVKFGYDPRIDPASKVYQSIDIRVPSSVTTVKPSSLHRKRGLQKSTIAGISCSVHAYMVPRIITSQLNYCYLVLERNAIAIHVILKTTLFYISIAFTCFVL